ncbi:MAG: MFS transporter, partial [Polaromonas sp. 39-63-203]
MTLASAPQARHAAEAQPPAAGASAFTARNGLRYGLLGLPLAFVALPLYVILPNHYAREFGMPLGLLGAILLGARLLDAFIDPLLGRLSDRLFARSARSVLALGAAAAVVLAAGFALLFFPLVRGPDALAVWAAVMLVITYAAYSALSVSHQSWGAMLGGNETQRSRIVAWREGLGLVGVVLASITPVALGLPATTALFFVALGVGWLAWVRAPRPLARPSRQGATQSHAAALWAPLRHTAFRRLLAVFMLNGIASAVPARIGLARAWLAGMLLAIAVFGWATQLGAGDTTAFVLVCALSGVALGTDLALPGALLAGLIQAHGQSGQSEGAYFGWWNFATKLNLALAAGLALPLLGLFGYAPGARDASALNALVIAYCVLPCVLKLAAA